MRTCFDGNFHFILGTRHAIYLKLALLVVCMSSPYRALQAQESPPESQVSETRSWPSKILAPLPERKYLLGDWGGERSRLEEKGIVFDFFYTVDALSSVSGGNVRANSGFERVRGTMDVDFEKLHLAKDLILHVTGVWQAGVNLGNQYIGTVANPTSLPSTATTRLDSFWIQKGSFGDRLFLKGGQMAGMDLYDLQEYSESFINQPMGYTPATTVQNTYLPYDPGGTPGAEIRVVPKKNYYVKAAIFSANRNLYPDDPNGFHFDIQDAPVIAGETGFLVQPRTDDASTKELGSQASPGGRFPGIYKLGALYNSGKFLNPVTNVSVDGNYLIYLQANQAIYRMGKVGTDAQRGLDVTFQANGSPADVSRTNFQFDLGVRYLGPFAHRPQDSVALGYVYSHLSSNFDTAPTATTPSLRLGHENLFELNYRANVSRWFYYQPVVQFYENPGAHVNQRLGNTVVIGLRTKVTF